MAGNVVLTTVNGMQRWRNTFTPIHNLRTAIGESAAIIVFSSFRHSAGNCVQLCSPFIPCGGRFQEFHCVWMLRGFVELRPCPHLGDLSSVHNSNTISDIGNNTQVVCNQEYCHLQLLLESLDKFKNLCLYRDIQCRCRFISDEEPWATGECHRNHDTLFHATRHLVRVFIVTGSRFRNTDEVEHLNRSIPCSSAA